MLRDKAGFWVALGLAVLCASLIIGLSDELHGDVKPEASLVRDSAVQRGPQRVRIGVLAKRGPERCMEKWRPTAEYLTDEIPGYSFSIVPLSYDDICPSVEQKAVDLVLANSSFYVGFEVLHGARRILTLKNLELGRSCTLYGGVIFHRADRKDIQRLDDLRGKTFMAVEKTSFGGWLAAWRELKERGIDPFRDFAELKFGGTHDAVVHAVIDGVVDAGAVRTDTLERMAAEGKVRLQEYRVIHEHGGGRFDVPFQHSTRLYPEWPLAKLPHTSEKLAEEVTIALLRMRPDNPAAKAARCAGWTIPLNYQPVHDCLKELRVRPYEDYGKVSVRDIIRQYWLWLVALGVLAVGLVLLALRLTQLNQRLTEAVAGQRKEIAERKRAQEKIAHLNLVLCAIRNVNQLIVREKDRDRLIKGACEVLTENRGYHRVWVALLDDEQRLLSAVESGLGKPLKLLMEAFKLGELPRCARSALEQADIVAVEDVGAECEGCPLAPHLADGAAFVAPLGHQGKIYGILHASIPLTLVSDKEERLLFQELTNDLSFALHGIEQEEKRKRAEEALRASEERYRSVFENTGTATVIIEQDTTISMANAQFEKLCGHRKEEIEGKMTWTQFVVEEDLQRMEEYYRKRRESGLDAPREYEFRFVDRQGNVSDISLNIGMIPGTSKSVASLLDITERKRAKEKGTQLNLTLRAIRNVNQLITHEKDRDRLIKDSCEILTKNRGYNQAWIALLDESRHLLSVAKSGLGEAFEPMLDLLKRGHLTRCIQLALEHSDCLVVTEAASECLDCPLSARCSNKRAFLKRLERAGKIYGLLTVSVPSALVSDKEEHSLFTELANDLGFALHDIELEEERERAEEALRASELRYRSLVENLPQKISIKDKHSTYVSCNENMARDLVITPQEIGGKTDYDFFPKELAEKYRADDKRIMASGKIEELDERYIQDGEERIVRTVKTPLRDEEGNVTGILAIFWDITDKKRAEEELGRLAMIAEQAGEGIATADLDGNLMFVNLAWARMHGYEPAELLGKHLNVFHNEEQLEKEVTLFNEEVKRSGYHAGEVGHVRKDGTVFPTAMTATLFRDARGKPVGLIGFAIDITERKRAGEALREKEERFRSLVETSADFVWETDANDVYTYVSPKIRDILGYEPEEVLGKTHFDLKPPEEAARVSEISRSIVASRRPFSLLENEHLHKDGHLVILESSGVPFFDSDGTFRGYRGIDRDVTERKVLQSQLAQAQRLEAIGQLAAGIAHEINTPTQYVGDNVSFLKDVSQDIMKLLGEYGRLLDAARDGTITPELISEISAVAKEVDVGFLSREIPSAVEQALEGVERISNIVRAMRQFAHPGTKEKVTTDLNRAIENTITVSRNEWKYVAEMVTELDPDLLLVELLPNEFNQMILNIIVNAAHAIADVIGDGSTDKGKITIGTRRDGDWVEIRISDTGTGIPQDVRDRIFDPFFTTKEVGKGTGQGLAIARSVIVDKHDGTLTLESEEGKGTTFIIRLPINPDHNQKHEQ